VFLKTATGARGVTEYQARNQYAQPLLVCECKKYRQKYRQIFSLTKMLTQFTHQLIRNKKPAVWG